MATLKRNVSIRTCSQLRIFIEQPHFSSTREYFTRNNILLHQLFKPRRVCDFLVGSAIFTFPAIYSDILTRCIPLVYGIFLMILAVYKSAIILKEDPGLSIARIIKIIVRDQVVYFMA